MLVIEVLDGVLDRNAPQVFSRPERDFPYFAEVTPHVEDGLLIRFTLVEKPRERSGSYPRPEPPFRC
jgi:hypothetical protein